MTAFLVVLAVGAGSYLFRISMLVLAARSGLPPVLERAARLAVPVSFAALATGALADDLAAPGAIVAVRRTGSPPMALVAGMPTLWLLSAVLPA